MNCSICNKQLSTYNGKIFVYHSFFEKEYGIDNIICLKCEDCNKYYLNDDNKKIINDYFNKLEEKWLMSFIHNDDDIKKYFFSKKEALKIIQNENILLQDTFHIIMNNKILFLKKSIFRLKNHFNGKFPIKEGFIDFDINNDKIAKYRKYCGCGREMKLIHSHKYYDENKKKYFLIKKINVYKCNYCNYIIMNDDYMNKIQQLKEYENE